MSGLAKGLGSTLLLLGEGTASTNALTGPSADAGAIGISQRI